MSQATLFCCDLDRTLIPNGAAPESVLARPLFAQIAALPEIALVYASGRDRGLMLEAIEEYELPQPAHAICSVGAEIFSLSGGKWEIQSSWRERLAGDWQGMTTERIAGLLEGIGVLELQEEAKQKEFKLSFYYPPDMSSVDLDAEIKRRLESESVKANTIFSIDEEAERGLLDILPGQASKASAVEFLARSEGYPTGRVVYAGDSGNDLAVFKSGFPAVAVANVAAEIRDEVLALASDPDRELYLARGDFLGMNGNYAAGALEGLAHHVPDLRPAMEDALESLKAP